jgi:septum formation protein
MNLDFAIVLGSRSPQRVTLLRQLVPEDKITICPPRSAKEQGFECLENWPEIEYRLVEIARTKCEDVLEQIRERNQTSFVLILTADTVIVAEDGPRQIVLGQPPESHWKETTRRWFQDYLLGKTHRVATAVCLATLTGEMRERVVVSEVSFCQDQNGLLEWYLETGEPKGKAGGYGIQGAGSLFVTTMKGSLSNIIGLPLEYVRELLTELQSTSR